MLHKRQRDVSDVLDDMSDDDIQEQTAEFDRLSDVIALRDQYLKDQRLFTLPPEDIFPDPNQPREHFDEEEVKALAESMDELGQSTPIKIYYSEANKRMEILFGETRWRAKSNFCTDRAVLCVLVQEPDAEARFDNQVDENLHRSSFTVAETLKITARYVDRYEAKGVSDVVKRVAERLKRPDSEISRRMTVLNAMKVKDDLIGNALAEVIAERKLENLSALYFLSSALLSTGADRRKHPARDLILQAKSEEGAVTRAAAETAYKQATKKAKLSYSWKPKFLQLPEPEGGSKSIPESAAETAAPKSGEGNEDASDGSAGQSEEGKAEQAPKPPGRVLKTLSVGITDNSEYLKLTANTGYITRQQAVELAEKLMEAAGQK